MTVDRWFRLAGLGWVLCGPHEGFGSPDDEMDMVLSDGSAVPVRWLRHEWLLHRDPDGAAREVIGVFVDVDLGRFDPAGIRPVALRSR